MADKQTKDILEVMGERNAHEYDWFKYSIGIIATISGLIISIKKGHIENCCERTAFICAILSSGLCILCGVIFLYGRTETLHQLAVKLEQHRLHGNDVNTVIQSAPKKIFGILRVCFFVFLIASIIFLVAYGILSA